MSPGARWFKGRTRLAPSAEPDAREGPAGAEDGKCCDKGGAQCRAVAREEADEEKAVEGGGAEFDPGKREGAERVEVGGRADVNDGRERTGAGGDGGTIERFRDRAFEAERVLEDQAAGATDGQAIAQESRAHLLAHRAAAEDDRFECQKGGTWREVDRERTVERGTIEEDGLLREPFERRSGADEEMVAQLRGRAIRRGAVEALGRLAGDGGGGAFLEADRDARAGPPGRRRPSC